MALAINLTAMRRKEAGYKCCNFFAMFTPVLFKGTRKLLYKKVDLKALVHSGRGCFVFTVTFR